MRAFSVKLRAFRGHFVRRVIDPGSLGNDGASSAVQDQRIAVQHGYSAGAGFAAILQ